MPFVKLDTSILNSTLWVEKECRDVFITALLMAEPFELLEPLQQIEVRSLDFTGFFVPPGWYGKVRAAGVGILRQACVEIGPGMDALEKLGQADPESRSKDFEGRRMVRVDGGFIILNFMRYRDRDQTAAERARRYREAKKVRESVTGERRDRHGDTQRSSLAEVEAEAEADADAEKSNPSVDGEFLFEQFKAAHPRATGSQAEQFAFWEACVGNRVEAKRIIALASVYAQAVASGDMGHQPARAVNWLRDRVYNEKPEFWRKGTESNGSSRSSRNKQAIQEALKGVADE